MCISYMEYRMYAARTYINGQRQGPRGSTSVPTAVNVGAGLAWRILYHICIRDMLIELFGSFTRLPEVMARGN